MTMKIDRLLATTTLITNRDIESARELIYHELVKEILQG